MEFPIWQGVIIAASTTSMFAYILIVVHIFRGRKQIPFYNKSFFRLCLSNVWACLLWKLWAFQYITPFLIVLTTVVLQPLKPLTHVSSKSHVMFNFDDGPMKHLTLIGALAAALTMILSLLMYIMTIAKMRHFRRTRIFSTNLKISSSSHSDLEKRCMASALLMFCGAVPHLMICIMIIAYHRSATVTSFYAHLWIPAADLMISAPPWALIVKSTKLRRYFREKVETLLDVEWLSSTKKPTITKVKFVRETRSAIRRPSRCDYL
ncbi:unnamed protein product [Cylicocyclus nassatus]|uniref:Uncharacterized protein n=1 Tax=Cylicocyclus nassatus TaxID=53992 RepID=A0AA36H762_CYLNA|nr:unnamed protein product [Cylicocyclus nassatus]